ncbi:MAG TPA: hypothetical protein VMW35_03895 [Myxococcota bacterium]|nr:hypothetical protein [Myxococcota bacterium]
MNADRSRAGVAATRRPVLACEGAPRDLGLDQGLALREELRRFAAARGVELPFADEVTSGRLGLPILERVVSALGAWARSRAAGDDPASALLERDLARHFPQLAERCEGLARGARVPERFVLEACEAEERSAAGAACLVLVADGAGPLVARALPPSRPPSLRLRRTHPENGLRSLELVSSLGLGAIAGVNEAGLAACWSIAAEPRGAGAHGPRGSRGCAAPAILLVQECLQRFESVEGAAGWCTDRPARGPREAAGAIEILLADASGAVAGVRRAGEGAARFAPSPVSRADAAAALGALGSQGAIVLDPRARRAALLSDPTRIRVGLEELDSEPVVAAEP